MIIFLYGQDDFRSQQKLKKIKAKFIKEVDTSANGLTTLDGQISDIKKISDTLSARSLLTSRRMIIIENIFLNKGKTIFVEVFDYLKKIKADKEEDVIIVIRETSIKTGKTGNQAVTVNAIGKEKPLLVKPQALFSYLVKQKFSQEFKLLTNAELISWIKKQVISQDGNITNQAAQTLISLVGNDLWQVNNEINKLINYKVGLEPSIIPGDNSVSKNIEVVDIEKLTKGKFDENIFALTDAISNKNKALATKLLNEQYAAGLTDSYLLSMFTRQFKILLQIRQALDSGLTSRKITSELRLHPFVIQKGISQVRNFNLPHLKQTLAKLLSIDFDMKNGRGDGQTMLDLLIAKI